ncbi:MAG: hypothetical protein KGL40_01650 [Rhodocyclaceae bacterium]|nr:hypothetical protein [Rhodocyclaceae bacterium]
MRLSFALVLTSSVLVAGCGSTDMASMPIQGSDHSLTLVREKQFAWSSGWDLAVVVSRMPECQRRHHLKHMGDGTFKVEVFRTPQARWILHQGKRWYIADTESCLLQQFEEKPADPGTLVGVFDDKSGALTFTQDPNLTKPAEPAADAQPGQAGK